MHLRETVGKELAKDPLMQKIESIWGPIMDWYDRFIDNAAKDPRREETNTTGILAKTRSELTLAHILIKAAINAVLKK